MRPSRRAMLKALGSTALALPFFHLLNGGSARAAPGAAKRVIFFYFPDGILGPTGIGEPSLWHCTGTESSFTVPDQLAALRPFQQDCLFFSGLSMGPTDSGSHPGGAKKLLTGVDGGSGESIDSYLSRTAGAQSAWRHLYLGAMATQNNASGDKFIVYPTAGQTVAPEDNPKRAFSRLFSSATPSPDAGTVVPEAEVKARKSVIDNAKAELATLKAKLGGSEATKLALHLEALREVELRVQGMPPVPTVSCTNPQVNTSGFTEAQLFEAAKFPEILRAQIDVMVTAMACGLTQVGTIQASAHTSELIMSRFPGTAMYEANYDMRSHQASHYGDRHDFAKHEVKSFYEQRRWFVDQFAYLIDQLKKRPDGSGTMLDSSVVLLCTEVCDGNTHSHDNMPFILAGRGGGKINPGRFLKYGSERHGGMLAAIAHAMGQPVPGWGQANSGPLAKILT